MQAAAAELLPRGVRGADLAHIAAGWSALFDEIRDADAIAARGKALFAVGAILLGSDDPQVALAGRYFALADVARRGLAPVLAVEIEPLRVVRAFRPLTALARLAVRDLRHGEPFEPEATPGRALALLGHRWTGMIG